MKVTDFKPQEEIPDQSGRVFLVTGGTAGIGKEFLIAMAAHNPGHLFFTGRNASSAEDTIAQVKAKAPSVPITFLQCDLGSVATVRQAADKFLEASPRLDVLVANAGVMGVPSAVTTDGHEVQFGTNFFGHAALISMLLPAMLRTAEDSSGADVRLVLTTSQGYALHPRGGVRFDTIRTKQEDINTWAKYGQAKLTALLWAREMARRYPQIRTVTAHPGVIKTGLIDSLSLSGKLVAYYPNLILGRIISQEQGAYNLLWAATAEKGKLENGAYYEPVGVNVKPKRLGADDELAKKLWAWTRIELEKFGIRGTET